MTPELKSASEAYMAVSTDYLKDYLDIRTFMGDFKNDYDLIDWNGQRQTVHEALKSVEGRFYLQCSKILKCLSWEDQITFVSSHNSNENAQMYLMRLLDDVQRSAIQLLT